MQFDVIHIGGPKDHYYEVRANIPDASITGSYNRNQIKELIEEVVGLAQELEEAIGED